MVGTLPCWGFLNPPECKLVLEIDMHITKISQKDNMLENSSRNRNTLFGEKGSSCRGIRVISLLESNPWLVFGETTAHFLLQLITISSVSFMDKNSLPNSRDSLECNCPCKSVNSFLTTHLSCITAYGLSKSINYSQACIAAY